MESRTDLLPGVILLFAGVLALLLPPPPSSLPTAAASLRTDLLAAASPRTPPAIVLFGDSVDSNMVKDWCRRRAPNLSLCFDKAVWNLPLPSDNCTGYQEQLDALVGPWSMHAAFMSCLPNAAAPIDSPALVSIYNLWGTLNRRPNGFSPAPPAEMTLRDIWAPSFALIPHLLGRRPPTALLVQSLFWDLLAEQNFNKDYLSLANESFPLLLSEWVERYGKSAGALLDITAGLSRDCSWPLELHVWRTANEVSSEASSGWQRGANAIIRRANDAATKAAALRNITVFRALEGVVPLRDVHHPSEPVSVAAMDSLIAEVLRRGLRRGRGATFR